MVNRFTNRNRYAQFQPMSFEEYARVPLIAQQMQDKTAEEANALETYLNANPWDREAANKYQNEINSGITDIATRLSENSIYDSSIKDQLLSLKQKKQRLKDPNSEAYRIQAAYEARNKFMEDLAKDDKRSEQDKQDAIALADRYAQQQAAKGKYGSYGSITPPQDYDYQEEALEYAQKMRPQVIKDYVESLNGQKTPSGWQYAGVDHGNHKWVKNGVSTTRLPPELIQAGVQEYLTTNPKAMELLKFRASAEAELRAKDRMRNNSISTRYNSYNPENLDKSGFARDVINETIEDVSRVAAIQNQRNNVEFNNEQQLRTLSDAEINANVIDNALKYPIFRNKGFFLNSKFNEDDIKKTLDPSKAINRKLINSEGKQLSPEEFKANFKQAYFNAKNKADYAGLFKVGNVPPETLDKAAEEMYSMFTTGNLFDQAALVGSNLWNIITPFDYTMDDKSEMKTIMSELGDFRIRLLTPEDRKKLKTEADKKLEFQMNQYNSTVSPGQRVTSVEDYRDNVLEPQLREQAELPLRTVDYQIPSNDLVSREVTKGNFSALRGMSIIIQNKEKEKIEDKPEETLDKLAKLSAADKVKVSQPTRVLNGPYPGGRRYTVSTEEGTYEIYTEPLTVAEERSFQVEETILSDLHNPTFYGTKDYDNYPMVQHLTQDGVYIQYAPTKYYSNGRLSTGVRSRSVDINGNVLSQEDELSIEDFHQERERYRQKTLYDALYRAENLNKKVSPEG